ncbi:MAG: hypothetical protein ACP5I4_11715 [Oceanipulchritudo sp.]
MKKLLPTLALFTVTIGLNAENILFWDTWPIEGGIEGPTTLESFSSATGVQPSTLALGPGITPRATNDPSRFQGENFNANTLVEALEIGDYFEFTLTPEAGKSVSLDDMTIVLRNRGGSTGERTIAVVTSADGYATVVATLDMVAGNLPEDSGPKTASFSGLDPITEATTFRIAAYFPNGFDNTKTHPLTIGWASEDELTTTPALLITGTVTDAGEAWNGYPVNNEGWADTGSWLGLINVTNDPWIWIQDLASYAYIQDDSGWVYVAK